MAFSSDVESVDVSLYFQLAQICHLVTNPHKYGDTGSTASYEGGKAPNGPGHRTWPSSLHKLLLLLVMMNGKVT